MKGLLRSASVVCVSLAGVGAGVWVFVVKFFESTLLTKPVAAAGRTKLPRRFSPCLKNPVARTSADYNIKPRERESPRGFRPDLNCFDARNAPP
jgi:hypothetical protein